MRCREDNTTFIEPTEIRLDSAYQMYYINWTRTVLHAFLPFVMLAVLNGRIIHQMWKAEKIAARAMHRVNRRVSQSVGRKEA